MTGVSKKIVVQEEREVPVVLCDAPDCDAEKRLFDYSRARPQLNDKEEAWYRLSLGTHHECGWMRDACSKACLLRIAQTLEVTQ